MKIKSLLCCASLLLAGGSLSHAGQILRYDFENISGTTVPNLASPTSIPAGTLANGAQTSITDGVVLTVNGTARSLGKVMNFSPSGGDATGDGNVGHVNTNSLPSALNYPSGGGAGSNCTMMAWTKWGSTVGDNMIFGQNGGNRLHLGSRNGEYHSGNWGDDIGPDQGQHVATGTGVWHHVAFVNEGQHQRVYVDATLIFEGADDPSQISSSDNVVIATSGNNGSFVGSLDEVRVYNTALTQAEVLAAMNDLPEVQILTLEQLVAGIASSKIVLKDHGTGILDPAGAYSVTVNGTPIPAPALSLSKTGDTTTITLNLPADPNTNYNVSVTVTRTGGIQQTLTGSVLSYRLPTTLAGPSGTVGTWGIREYRPATFSADYQGAEDIASAGTETHTDGTAPVLNMGDPDTNGPRSSGNFNNDFAYLTNTGGTDDNNIVIVAKTQVTVAAAGDYTFAVQQDDGFAMRVSGGAGGRFTSRSGSAIIDPNDNQTLVFATPGDTASRGVYHFDGAGTYDILMLNWEGGGGAYIELAWAPGAWVETKDTNLWSLVGNPADPSVPPLRARFYDETLGGGPNVVIPGPAGTDGNWGVRVYHNAASTDNLYQAMSFLNSPAAIAGSTVNDAQSHVINFKDPDSHAGYTGLVMCDDVYPGDTAGDTDRVVLTAHAKLDITEAGLYTFNCRGDDGFLLRFLDAGATIVRVAGGGTFQMSNPREAYFDTGTGDSDTRVIVNFTVGIHPVEYVYWEGVGGHWNEVTAAKGSFPNTGDTNQWRLVGQRAAGVAQSIPSVTAAGWSVKASAPSAFTTFDIASAEAGIDGPGNTTTIWDKINFTDPQTNATAGYWNADSPWPNDTAADDNNYAMRADADITVSEPGAYTFGFRGDDGGYLIITGVGATPTPSFTNIIINFTNATIIENDGAGGTNNKIRCEVGTGDSLTLARTMLVAGTYHVKAMFYEGGGGSNWEVLTGRPLTDGCIYNTTVVPLLQKNAVPTVLDLPGIQLSAGLAPEIVNVVTNPNGTISVTFTSEQGGAYVLESSESLDGWILEGEVEGQAGTTTITGVLNGYLTTGAQRYFYRVRRNTN